MKRPGLHHWNLGCALVHCVPATALEGLCGQAGMVAPGTPPCPVWQGQWGQGLLAGVQPFASIPVPGLVAREWRWQPGQRRSGALPCPTAQRKVARQQLTQEQKEGRKYLRGSRREERPKIKNRTKKTPVWIQGVALHAVPDGENIPEGIFHYCSATLVSLLKTFSMCISNSCRKSSPCVSCNVDICIPSVTDGNCCLALQMIWRGFNT